jgi:hypothetical protein
LLVANLSVYCVPKAKNRANNFGIVIAFLNLTRAAFHTEGYALSAGLINEGCKNNIKRQCRLMGRHIRAQQVTKCYVASYQGTRNVAR